MGKQRKQHSGDFKARVALDAIKGQHTLREISTRYRIHPNMVVKWKKRALDELSTIFEHDRAVKDKESEQEKTELYEQIGRLKMELEWVKKKAGVLD